MRELPEVETIRRELDKEVSGKRIKTVDVHTTMSALPGHPNKKNFTSRLEGTKVKNVARRGLVILVNLDSSDTLVFDPGTGGWAQKVAAKDELAKPTLVSITFTQGGQLRLLDASGTATLSVLPTDDFDTELPELATLGLDPVETPVSWTLFAEMLRGQKTKLKNFLLDQTIIVGLGDLYADEILWSAGLSGSRESHTLSAQEVRRLYRAVLEVLYEAVKQGGTAEVSDGDPEEEMGDFGDHIKVFQREGLPCARCRQPIFHDQIAKGLWSYHCKQCQS